MALSILKPDGFKTGSVSISSKTLYNLSVDRIFRIICPDTVKRKYFLDVVSEINYDDSVLDYRMEVLNDFLNEDGLLDELYSIYSRFEELRSSLKSSLKLDNRMDFSYDSSVTSKKNELRTYSLAFKRGLCFIRGICEVLSKYNVQSSALIYLLEECKRICENDCFEKLMMMCSKYEYISERGILDFKYTLTDNMRIDSFELIDHRYIHISDPDIKRKFVFKKKKEDNFVCMRVEPSDNNFFNSLISGAFSDIGTLFKNLTDQIFKKFLGIKSELDFYFVSIKYVRYLEERKIKCVFAQVSRDNKVVVKELYDLFLVTQMDNIEHIVPNDYIMLSEIKGIIIYGNNGSGKTVYLRAFGIMQLLAQAGLPVPCESCKIKLYSNIVTQFAEAECENADSDNCGRFETEVKEIAEIVNSIENSTLVLLNETFQSTVYKEGAEGLSNVLNYFIDVDCTFILVSHLHDLKQMIDLEKVNVLNSNEFYVVFESRPAIIE